MASSESCLVARAIPLRTSVENDAIGVADSLAAHLDALSLGLKQNKNGTDKKAVGERKKMREEANISPADHLALQSFRSSALARKTNTTARLTRDCRKLFADLMMGEDKEKQPKTEKNEAKPKGVGVVKEVQQANREEKKAHGEGRERLGGEKGEESVELLARGPIRVPPTMARGGSSVFHPYSSVSAHPNVLTAPNDLASPSVSFNATALQSTVFDQSSYNSMASVGYGYSYDCGLPSNWSCGGGSAGRDSLFSSPSSTPDTALVMSPGDRSEKSELPDDLSDFILEYSRRYSPSLSRKYSLGSQGAAGESPASNASSEEDQLCLSSGNSPLCAPQSSPAAPRGAIANVKHSPPFGGTSGKLNGVLPIVSSRDERTRPSKERLRAMIRSEDMDDAWAWTCKCIQRHPMALNFQDGDGDTLLHIVMAHLDYGKIYALVEQMLKSEVSPQKPLLFDVPNRMRETPYKFYLSTKTIQITGG
uniref:Uncharacterized protein n=1 Tax=Globodera rostochiensis TaxID=31243 RepID=A0A914HYC0_GLORO